MHMRTAALRARRARAAPARKIKRGVRGVRGGPSAVPQADEGTLGVEAVLRGIRRVRGLQNVPSDNVRTPAPRPSSTSHDIHI